MADVALARTLEAPAWTAKIRRTGIVLAWTVIIALALFFVAMYASRYFLSYDAATYGKWWAYSAPLLLHITGGMVALFTGPWQFFSGYRRQPMHVHRWTGRIFVAGVAMGVIGAVYLSFTSALLFQPTQAPGAPRVAQAFGLFVLAIAWASTTAMAYYAIRLRRIELHKEWMIRAYVVTFAFVTFRIFADFAPLADVLPRRELVVTLFWASWVIPLFITELVLQLKKMRRTQPAE